MVCFAEGVHADDVGVILEREAKRRELLRKAAAFTLT